MQQGEKNWDYKSIEDFTPDAIEGEGVKNSRKKRGEILRDLILHIEDELKAGRYVEQRTLTGWKAITPNNLDEWIKARTYPVKEKITSAAEDINNQNRNLHWIYSQDWPGRIEPGAVFKPYKGDLRQVIRSSDPQSIPHVVTVPNYGRTLDLTGKVDWNLDAGKLIGDRRALAKYCRQNGIGRVIIPDAEWGKTTLVLRDSADKSLGGQGAEPWARMHVAELMKNHEVSTEGVLPSLPDGIKSRIAERRVTRKQFNAQNRAAKESLTGPNYLKYSPELAKPVSPTYTSNTLAAMTEQGLMDEIKRLAREKAQTQVDLEHIGNLRTQRANRVSQRGNKRITSLTGISDDLDAVMMKRISNRLSNERLVADGNKMVNAGFASHPTQIRPTDPQYYRAWANTLNQKFSGQTKIDPIVKQVLAGHPPSVSIKWATETVEGREYVNQFNWKDPEDAIKRIHTAVPLYIPTERVKADFLLGNINEDTLRKGTEGHDLQPLHAELVPWSTEYMDQVDRAGNLVSRTANRMLNFLGTIPEDHLLRMPLYRAVYKHEWDTLTKEATARLGGEKVTIEQAERLRLRAAESARQTVNRTLYTIERRTDAATKLRWVSPFYAAWENAVRRWTGFAIHSPDALLRMSSRATHVANNMNLIDQDGNPIDLKSALTNENFDKVTMVAPQWLVDGVKGAASKAGMGDIDLKSMKIPLSSFDVAFGGQPGPGIGPWAQLPLYQIVKQRPEANNVLKWAFPAGIPQNYLSMFLPSWAKKFADQTVEDSAYANTFNGVMGDEIVRWCKGERTTRPTLSEIEDKTKNLYNLRMLTNLLAPVSVQYGNELDWYTSQYRAIQNANAGKPDEYKLTNEQFLNKFPEAFVVLNGRSKNTSGAYASSAAVNNIKRYANLYQHATGVETKDPSLFGFVANYGLQYSKADYNPAAYSWEMNNNAGFDTPTFRTKQNPNDVFSQGLIDRGWVLFNKSMDATEASLTQQGIDPASTYGQKVMSSARSMYAKQHRYFNESNGKQIENPWYTDWHSLDKTRYDRRASFFTEMLQDQTFMNDHGKDPLIQSIGQYLKLRNQVSNALVQGSLNGGKLSLNSKKNADIANYWFTHVQDLKLGNMEFAAWANRYFTNDTVVF